MHSIENFWVFSYYVHYPEKNVDGMRGVGLIQGIQCLQWLEVEHEFYLIGKLLFVDPCSNPLIIISNNKQGIEVRHNKSV